MTFSLPWYVIPLVISMLALAWAFFWPADRSGMFGSLTTIMMLIPALVLIAIVWAVSAFLK